MVYDAPSGTQDFSDINRVGKQFVEPENKNSEVILNSPPTDLVLHLARFIRGDWQTIKLFNVIPGNTCKRLLALPLIPM